MSLVPTVLSAQSLANDAFLVHAEWWVVGQMPQGWVSRHWDTVFPSIWEDDVGGEGLPVFVLLALPPSGCSL